jgi:hypothetical protein
LVGRHLPAASFVIRKYLILLEGYFDCVQIDWDDYMGGVSNWKKFSLLLLVLILAGCQNESIPILPVQTTLTPEIVPSPGYDQDPPVQECEYWVAPVPVGDNNNPGSFDEPWATLEYAAAQIPDDYCTVWFKDGVYSGGNNLTKRFETPTLFKALNPYRAVLENSGNVIELDGVRNMIFDGFEMRHSGAGANRYIVIADRRNDIWSENVVFRNNILHDSYNEDVLKIHNGARFFTVEGNIFYNQSAPEQHIDVNSVTDIVIQDNIFYNDFEASGRLNNHDTKHFIVVKDSNDDSDGLEGSERIVIRRNIFLHWQGGNETFIQIGNDGKPYHEAENVQVENNLMVGDGTDSVYAVFGVKGAKDVTFRNNTVVGNMPANAYALDISITGENPLNENLIFVNNIWSDPSGTMGVEEAGRPKFSNGKAASTENLLLDNNLYWNGGNNIPNGNSVAPMVDDARRIVDDPLLNTDQTNLILPYWNGTSFLSGNTSIKEEFIRLVELYGRIPANSPAVGRADPILGAMTDIFGRVRGSIQDLGAYETNVIIN